MSDQISRDYSISLIRLIATIFIVSCHMMQYLNSTLSWWFNVGVQIFLFMSGFLFGKKKSIENNKEFIKKHFTKILVDYYIVIIPVIIAFFIFYRQNISYISAFKILITFCTISGGEHLWYIPYCLLTYLFTPFLIKFYDRIQNGRIVMHSIILVIITIVLTETFLDYFNSAWVVCYLIGFFFGRIVEDENRKTLYKAASLFFITFALIANGIQIAQDDVVKLKLIGLYSSIYSSFRDYAHVALGVSLFLIFKAIITRIFKNGYPRVIKTVCNQSDKLSYDVYLVHHFIILGPFSLMALTRSIPENIFIIVTLVILSAALVHFISSKLQSKLSD